MFKHELTDRLGKIFGFSRVTFDAPTNSHEQDTLFIQIDSPLVRVTGKKVVARVQGSVILYVQEDRLSYGMLAKRIAHADPSLTKDFFFHDIDQNLEASPATRENITERRVSFVFFYSADFDPNQGQITSLTQSMEIEE